MRTIDMAEFVGEEPISVGVDEPITFENKTDTAFDVGCGIVFRKSGLYRVSIVGGHMSVAVEPERKQGQWLPDNNNVYETRFVCSCCKKSEVVPTIGFTKYIPLWDFCPNCGAKNEEG